MAMRIQSLPYVIQIITRIIASLSIMLLMSFISTVHGRILTLNSSDDLISDGIDQSVALIANDVLVSASTCHHTYGFLPCAENAGGYIYQILVYHGLLIFGEMQLTSGSKVFFKILENYFGTSKYVSIIFQILMELPAMMMMILSGVFGSKETARSLVSLGVGIYAGITVFTLTLQWGICLIFGAKYSGKKTKPDLPYCQRVKGKFNELKDTSVKVENGTRNVAGIMLLSLIPYIIVLLVDIFNTYGIVLLIALIVSAASLLLYFIYQIVDPLIQTLSSNYLQYQILFLQHAERRGKLVEKDGSPNSALIKIVFDETDRDGDGCITSEELKTLFEKIMPELSDDAECIKNAVNDTMKEFDSNQDDAINESEFIKACVKLAEKNECISRELSEKDIPQSSPIEIDQIMSKILKHAESQLLKGESLITEDGKPNIERINNIFRQYDDDNNKTISRKELKEIIEKVEFGNLKPKYEDVVDKIFFHFDINRDNTIDKEEFVHVLERWLDEAIHVAKCRDKTKSVDEFDKIVWAKVSVPGYSFLDFVKCVFRIVLGIVILTFIGGPLTTSILQLSYAMNVPSFSISFVIVPLAMNTRTLIEAIFPVSKKTKSTASLTFSEVPFSLTHKHKHSSVHTRTHYSGALTNNCKRLASEAFSI
ncbi:sodium calcium exchanger NCL-like [Olea europaea subsp. europaea]|uniref:Sodium calcium exchanger NCL-like n=1 Tax=Olea europaea subsp. europaea TaxID=158383 RepID=A0A8S0T4M3_OLEEU|nr:sodium calcium exchanger NCL-like [Olea europaea subsp. europaea]